jgi:hypothetical protein
LLTVARLSPAASQSSIVVIAPEFIAFGPCCTSRAGEYRCWGATEQKTRSRRGRVMRVVQFLTG